MSDVKKVLLIFPGPIHKVEEAFRVRLENYAPNYLGVMLTNGTPEAVDQLGEFEIIKYPVNDMSIMDTFKFYKCAINLVKKHSNDGHGFDLIVTYDPLKMGILGVLLSKMSGAKLIVEVNGDYADRNNYIDEKNGFKRFFKRKAYVAIAKRVLKRATGIKLLFDSQIDFCRSSLKNTTIMRFPDFVDIEPFEKSGEKKVILVAGFPFFRKGIDLLIEAFKNLSDKHPDWSLKILGHFPDQKLLNKYIAGHPKIFHQKAVYYKEMPEHVQNSAIVALPSRSEAMGRIMIEAMIAGKARVGTDVGGIHTVINDGEDGFLFESENVSQLQQLLDDFMGSSDLRRKFGEASIRRAKKEFGKENYFVSLNQLYQRVLDK